MMTKANWEKLIESYIKLPEPVNRVFLIPLPFAEVDSACSTYTEVAEWNDAWGVNVRAYSEPDKHRIRYTLDVYDDEPQYGSPYFMLPTKSVGEITIRRVSENRTELSIKAAEHNDKLVTMVATTFLKNWMDERQWSQYWADTKDEQPTANQQSGSINFGPINSAGDVNINLSHVAGRDHIGAYASSVRVSPTYQELLEDGIKFLKSLSYDKAIDKLREAAKLENAETKAYYYLAIALLKGRSFNSSSLHLKTRNEIEKHLKHAHIDNPNWLPPLVLLAVMEIEYHSLHGTPNKNVVIDDVAKRVKQEGLSPEESQLLSSCRLGERTKRRLHLTF